MKWAEERTEFLPIVCCVSREKRKADRNDLISVTHGVWFLLFSNSSGASLLLNSSKYCISPCAYAIRYHMTPRNSHDKMKFNANTTIVQPGMECRNVETLELLRDMWYIDWFFFFVFCLFKERYRITYAIECQLKLWKYPGKDTEINKLQSIRVTWICKIQFWAFSTSSWVSRKRPRLPVNIVYVFLQHFLEQR